MDDLSHASLEALRLLFTGDKELWTIISISFGVSLKAMVITIPPALALAFVLAHTRFPGHRALLTLFQTLLSVPTVVLGLLFYLLLSRSGPLGDWKLLFTQSAMVIGQVALGFPIVVAMAHAALQAADRRAWETARTLGAGPVTAMLTLMHEVRYGLIAAVLAAFGRIIGEIGCSMMLGGNILNYTRNITTAIALETSKGEFAQGIALGLVLLLLALVLNFVLSTLQGKGVMVS